jgi:hypothetical protein
MTSDPETPLDVVIDEVARDMLAAATPNLRIRVAASLDGRAARFVAWRPALATLVVVACATLVVFLSWERRIGQLPAPPPPIHTEPRNDAAPPVASITPRHEQVARRAERRPFTAAITSEMPHVRNDIDAIDVTLIEIDALQFPISGIVPMDVEQMSIAPITVAPLSPIADEESR